MRAFEIITHFFLIKCAVAPIVLLQGVSRKSGHFSFDYINCSEPTSIAEIKMRVPKISLSLYIFVFAQQNGNGIKNQPQT